MTDAEQLAKLLRRFAWCEDESEYRVMANALLLTSMPVQSAAVPEIRARLIDDAVALVLESRP